LAQKLHLNKATKNLRG